MGKFPTRFISSIIISLTIFALIIVAFNLAVGWPVSLLSLIITVGVAWFFAAGLAGRISKKKWSVAIPSFLAIVLIVTTLGAGIPWDLNPEETVTFKMEASFTYLGSEENLPIENVVILFPSANLENNVLPINGSWKLYYLENDNSLTLQADESKIYTFRGSRKSNIKIISHGIDVTQVGPMYFFEIDRLYPREVFWITNFVDISLKDANKISLSYYEDHKSAGGYRGTFSSGEFGKAAISLSFWAQLSKRIDGNTYEKIETYSCQLDNVWNSWIIF